MALPTTVAEALEETALGPKSVSTDKGRVEAQSIGDLLKALEYTAGQTAAAKNHLGLRFCKLEAPGAG